MFSTKERWLVIAFAVTWLSTSCHSRDYFQLVNVLAGHDGTETIDHTIVTNNFVDDHIQKLSRYVQLKGDSVELQDFSYEDTFKWFFKKGGYRLTNCRLNFLTRIARSSDSYLTVDGTVLTKLGMRGLQLQCDGVLWFGILRQHLNVQLTADYIQAEVQSKIVDWRENVPEIADLTITHLGRLDADIRGMGILRKVLNAIVRSKINKKRENIVNKINRIAVQNINYLLRHLPKSIEL